MRRTVMPIGVLSLPDRCTLLEKSADAFLRILEREHPAELALQVTQLRLVLHVLRAIERAQPEADRRRRPARDLRRERHRRRLEMYGRPRTEAEAARDSLRRGQ